MHIITVTYSPHAADERACQTPNVPPGRYAGRLQRLGNAYPRHRFLVHEPLDDRRVVPILVAAYGHEIRHLRLTACEFHDPHADGHPSEPCPAGPVYCRTGLEWVDLGPATLVVVPADRCAVCGGAIARPRAAFYSPALGVVHGECWHAAGRPLASGSK